MMRVQAAAVAAEYQTILHVRCVCRAEPTSGGKTAQLTLCALRRRSTDRKSVV